MGTKHLDTVRNSHRRCSVKEGVLKSFANFIRNYLCWGFFIIKLLAFGPATLLKRDSTQLLCCKFCEIFKGPFLEDICEPLLTYSVGWLKLTEVTKYDFQRMGEVIFKKNIWRRETNQCLRQKNLEEYRHKK